MNFKSLIFTIVSTILFFNCSSDSNETISQPDPDPSNTVTYNSTIKSIMSANCTSCHGNPTTNSAPMSLTTYSEVKSAVQNRGLINSINNATNPMPKSGLMSQTNRELVQKWVDDGLLEN